MTQHPLRQMIRFQQYCVLTSIKKIWQRPITSCITVAIIAIALCMPAALYIIKKNLQVISDQYRSTGYITTFLKPSINKQEAEEVLQKIRLNANNQHETITLVSPEQALSEFKTLSNFTEAIELLGDNPLPYSIQITLDENTHNFEKIEQIIADLKKIPAIDYVQYDKLWLKRFRSVVQLLSSANNIITLFVVISLLLIVGNTIRAEIQNQYQEIEIKQLLGASKAFIGLPFIYNGAWLGLLSGIIANLFLYGIILLVKNPINTVIDAYESHFSIILFNWLDLLMIIAAGTVVSIIGSWLAVNKELTKLQSN